jgi:hypothetical protein
MNIMNSFQLTKPSNTSGNSNELLESDKASFKESILGIEKYWNSLNSELEKKKKDIEELTKMYKNYNMDEFISIIDNINNQIEILNNKMVTIQKVMWDVRGRILFTDSENF